MARVLTKKSTVAAKVPLATDLEIGELAVNTADAKLYTKHSDNTVKQLGIATNDSRLTDAREWTASTVTQAEAEAGTATTRRAWTAQRVFQAVAAWWAASADKTKLDGIQAGAQVNVGTNLAQGTRTTTAVPVTSSTGTGATLGAATTSLAGVMTAADKTKLDGVATGATANASDAQLRDRATHTGSQAISTVTGLQAALDNKINTSERGVSGGIATLDATARIPASQLPSYVDDVLEYATTAQFPATGETGKIYIAINQGTAANPTRQYRWTGSTYAEINPSPGTTDALAEGSTNLYFSEHRVRTTVLTGLSMPVAAAITAADTVLSALGKIQARLNLMGTAANANVQTSRTDTTAGALMAVGAFGVGTNTTPTFPSLADLPGGGGSSTVSQFFRLTAAGLPIGDDLGGWAVNRASRPCAFLFPNSQRLAMTRFDGAGWASPVEFFHTGNFDPATKANLDSPTFTGDPKAPTPAAKDNDTSIATTAFVHSAMGLFGLGTRTAGNRTPVLADADSYTTPTGLYRSAATANYPYGNNSLILVGSTFGAGDGSNDRLFELDFVADGASNADDIWYRRRFGTAWRDRVKLLHTGNFDPATKQDRSAVVTTASSRTLALSDAWNYLRPGTTGAVTLTVPAHASVAFDVGTEITIRALGNITLAAASGVTLNAPSGGTLNMTARMTVTLKKAGTNEWDVIGQTVPA